MSKQDDQREREHECVEFGCPHIFRCVTFLGKNCTRQGGGKIPTHRATDNHKKDGRTDLRQGFGPFPKKPVSIFRSYFIEG
jgi:hypothetical protein